MVQTAGRILKSNDVNVEGKFHLEMSQAGNNIPRNKNTTIKTPQATVIENNAGYVVIRVICSCGKEIKIRGEYAEPQKS